MYKEAQGKEDILGFDGLGIGGQCLQFENKV